MDIDLAEAGQDGQTLEFDRVLLVSEGASTQVGTPTVKGAKVTATIETAEVKGPKVDVVHFIRRKGHLTRQGHRQKYTRVRIDKIKA